MHVGNGGLQAHSIGPIYPWTIVVRGNTIFALHCETSEEKPAFEYIEGNSASFKAAHDKAEESTYGSNLYDVTWNDGVYSRRNKVTNAVQVWNGSDWVFETVSIESKKVA